MMRSFDKTIDEGGKLLQGKERYDLTIEEIDKLYNIYKSKKHFDGLWDLISAAFIMGTANGYRMRKAEEKKAKKSAA